MDADDNEDSLSFCFKLEGQKSFTLHCPLKYPDYDDEDNFFVETESGIQLWCNALNEFLLDSDRKLTLSAILNKGLSLYSSADQAVGTHRQRHTSFQCGENERVRGVSFDRSKCVNNSQNWFSPLFCSSRNWGFKMH